MTRTVLIADNQPICAHAYKCVVQRLDGAIEVEMVDSISAVESAIAKTSYTALLLDPELSDSEGLVNLSLVRSYQPKLPVLVISGSASPTAAVKAQVMGARGFLSKRASVEDIRAALSVILLGGQWFPNLAAPNSIPAVELNRLSPAQTRVMVELGRAKPNKLIAHNLNVTEATVKSHLSAIYRALNVSNRSQAILALQQTNG